MYSHAPLVLYKTNLSVLKCYNAINLSQRFMLIFVYDFNNFIATYRQLIESKCGWYYP